MTDVDVHELARELTAAIAALEVQIAIRAHEVAAPRIEAAEAIYEARATALEQQHTMLHNRSSDLIAEMRRQLKASDDTRTRLFDENKRLKARVSELEAAEFQRNSVIR